LLKVRFDTSDFKVKSMALIKKVKNASDEGMAIAIEKLMNDAIYRDPKCPVESGALAASHSVFLNGTLLSISDYPVTGGGEATPRMAPVPKLTNNIEGTLVVNKPYAAAQHEGTWKTKKTRAEVKKYTRVGSGKKWVESKLLAFGSEYFSIIAGRIKNS
jgi:hypothetical protein